MNKPPRITRAQIIECNWSWCSLNQAKAYRTALVFLRDARTETPALTPIKSMMRYHATEAIRQARLFTPSSPTP
jgi:hypothetical protein